MAGSRNYFSPDDVKVIVDYFVALKNDNPDFYTAFLSQQVDGRFFFEIQPKFFSLTRLDAAFGGSTVIEEFNRRVPKFMALFDAGMAFKYVPFVKSMVNDLFMPIQVSDEWKAFCENIPIEQQAKLMSVIAGAVAFKLLAVWSIAVQHEYRPEELMEIKKRLAKLLNAVDEADRVLQINLYQSLHTAVRPEDKVRQAEEILHYLAVNHKEAFKEGVHFAGNDGFVLVLAKAAFDVLGDRDVHPELRQLLRQRSGEFKEAVKSELSKEHSQEKVAARLGENPMAFYSHDHDGQKSSKADEKKKDKKEKKEKKEKKKHEEKEEKEEKKAAHKGKK